LDLAAVKIEVNLSAKAALGPNAHAIADNQHSDPQLWIDRRPAHLAVKRLQRLAEIIEVEVAVDAPKHRMGRVRRGRNHRTAAPAFPESPSSPSLLQISGIQ
jgi:hypothetical protein